MGATWHAGCVPETGESIGVVNGQSPPQTPTGCEAPSATRTGAGTQAAWGTSRFLL
jgi:hypothetical protein